MDRITIHGFHHGHGLTIQCGGVRGHLSDFTDMHHTGDLTDLTIRSATLTEVIGDSTGPLPQSTCTTTTGHRLTTIARTMAATTVVGVVITIRDMEIVHGQTMVTML